MSNTLFSLSGQTVLITGAGGGIGLALTHAFAHAGANVVATDIDHAALDPVSAVAGECQGIVPLVLDVTDEAAISAVLDHVSERFGRLDVLVNNAGVKSAEPLVGGNREAIDRTLSINTRSVLNCSRLAIERFMKGAGGRIINVGSSLSSQGAILNYQAGGADYCLSKAVVHDITRLLAYECASHQITVNAIAPGIIDTPMHGRPREESEARHAGRIPLGRVGLPADLAGLAIFLASPAASYITGQIVHVNGGMLMNG